MLFVSLRAMLPNWRGPYATKDIPTDPWGNEYQYVSPGPNGEDYMITSYGADGCCGRRRR